MKDYNPEMICKCGHQAKFHRNVWDGFIGCDIFECTQCRCEKFCEM